MEPVPITSPVRTFNDSKLKMSTAAVGAQMKAVVNHQEELAKRIKKISVRKERHESYP